MSDSRLTIASIGTQAAKLEKLANPHAAKTGTGETYRKFEAMVLQNFVKSMLGGESEEVYGKGVAGDMWKGMLAEQLGDAISRGGGIGIADALARGQKRAAQEA